MLVVRPVKEPDLDALFELIEQSEFGLTTLKVSKSRLRERIGESLAVFAKPNARPRGQAYVFVMEDSENERLVGTCAIYSKVGGFEPNYSYEIRTTIKESPELNIRKEIKALHRCETHNGPTEIGSLFLSPDYWGNGNGRILSLSRFMFVADQGSRFEDEIIAEMRGIVNEDGKSPLWSALGSHFYGIDYPKADTLSLSDKSFIADLMPNHPIYIPLLPAAAQDVIGKVHPRTQPAEALLKKEGFEYRGFVDIFDGGPTLHCKVDKIRAIANSRTLTVAQIAPVQNGVQLLASNQQIDFRCTLAEMEIDGDQATLTPQSAANLNVTAGDTIRAVELRPNPDK